MSDPNLTLHYNFAVDQSLVARIGPTLGIVRVGPATFFNSSGLIETVQTDVARFEYDPITRVSLGLLVEEKRTNDCLHNRDGTNAVWVKLNMTAVKDQVGEDGVANSATSLLATAGNATAIQAFTLGSTARTGTFSIKRLIGTGDVDITIDDGVTFTTVSINSLTYTRFDVTQTLANPDIGVRLVTSGDKIAIDFQGIEDGAFSTSRIATVASSVTRNADLVSTTDLTWYDQLGGTFYSRASILDDAASTRIIWQIDDGGSTAERTFVFQDGTNDGTLRVLEGGTQADLQNPASYSGGTVVGHAVTFVLNDVENFTDGTRSGTGDQSAIMTADIDNFRIGHRAGGSDVHNGHFAEIRYYNVRKDNTFLESLSNGIINEDSINLSTNLARPIVRNIARPY